MISTAYSDELAVVQLEIDEMLSPSNLVVAECAIVFVWKVAKDSGTQYVIRLFIDWCAVIRGFFASQRIVFDIGMVWYYFIESTDVLRYKFDETATANPHSFRNGIHV